MRQGTSLHSRALAAGQSGVDNGDGSESQAGVEGMGECRVECWNGGYLEAKTQAAASREQQDWLAHNREVLHELQVSWITLQSDQSTYFIVLGHFMTLCTHTPDCHANGTCLEM